MNLKFWKYQGTGNDFVMIDNRDGKVNGQNSELISSLCDRRFGIGGDGLILLEKAEGYDFRMVYFNANGKEGSMCGNGGRCTVAFAHQLGVFADECSFIAVDGPHEAKVQPEGIIDLKMIPVNGMEKNEEFYFMDTGSPHYVEFLRDLDKLNVVEKGRSIRYNDRFKKEGTNVNFAETTHNGIKIATYERGVEDETLSCGTGATASAIAFHQEYMLGTDGKGISIPVVVKGGFLTIKFDKQESAYDNIWLCGPAQLVFEGDILV